MKTLILENLEETNFEGFESFNIDFVNQEGESVRFDVGNYQFCETDEHDQETNLMQEVREALDITITELLERLFNETDINFDLVQDMTYDTCSNYYITDKTDDEVDLILTKWFNSLNDSEFNIRNGEKFEIVDGEVKEKVEISFSILDQIIYDNTLNDLGEETNEENLLGSLESMPEDFNCISNVSYDEMSETQQKRFISEVKEYIQTNA